MIAQRDSFGKCLILFPIGDVKCHDVRNNTVSLLRHISILQLSSDHFRHAAIGAPDTFVDCGWLRTGATFNLQSHVPSTAANVNG